MKYAVSIVKSREIVGHVPRSISKLFHFFIQHDSEITCEVTGRRRFGHGLEVPCYYNIKGRKTLVQKVKGYLESKSDCRILN